MPKLLQRVCKIGMCLCNLWVKQDAEVIALHTLLILTQVIVSSAHEQKVVCAVRIHCLHLQVTSM